MLHMIIYHKLKKNFLLIDKFGSIYGENKYATTKVCLKIFKRFIFFVKQGNYTQAHQI